MRMSTATRNRIAMAFARNRELRVSDVEAMIRAIEKPQGPAVIDVPLNTGGRREDGGGRGLEAGELEDAKRCVEIRTDGRRCGDPRDEGSERCERHTQWFRTAASTMGLPCPEDAVGLQDFLVRTLAWVMQGRFPPQQAGAITRLCGLIEKNMRAYRWQVEEARWQEAGRRRAQMQAAGRTLTTEGTEGTEVRATFSAEVAEIAEGAD